MNKQKKKERDKTRPGHFSRFFLSCCHLRLPEESPNCAAHLAPRHRPRRGLSAPLPGPCTPACRHFESSGSLCCTLAFVSGTSRFQLRNKSDSWDRKCRHPGGPLVSIKGETHFQLLSMGGSVFIIVSDYREYLFSWRERTHAGIHVKAALSSVVLATHQCLPRCRAVASCLPSSQSPHHWICTSRRYEHPSHGRCSGLSRRWCPDGSAPHSVHTHTSGLERHRSTHTTAPIALLFKELHMTTD